MADSTVTVELIAKIDQLIAGMSEGTSVVKSSLESIKGDLAGLNTTAKESEGALESILSIESFKLAAEIATESLEKVQEAFEATVGKAEEFGLSNEKFASLMGTSIDEAAGLSAALTNVGSSTDAYESIALRLGTTLETGGVKSKELSDQFKDANGHFLQGADLMARLKTVTDSYAEGADRTAVVEALLGKRAKDYYDISRVTADAVEHNIAIYKEMGINFETLGEQSRQLEESEGDLRTAWQAESVVIGQDLMPVAKAALQWLGGDGRELLKSLEEGVKFLMSTFLFLKTAVVEAVLVMTTAFVELWDSIKLGGRLIADVLTGNWKDIQSDWSKGTHEMSDDFKAGIDSMSHEASGLYDQIKSIYDPAKAAGEAPAKKAGKGAPTDLGTKGKKDNTAEQLVEEQIQAAEKLALEEISIDEATNAHRLAMGQETLEEFLEQERTYENNVNAVKVAALSKEAALNAGKPVAHQKTLDAIAQLEAEHINKLLKIDQDGATRQAAIDKDKVAQANEDTEDALKDAIDGLKRQEETGQISHGQMAQQETLLTQTVRTEVLARLDAEIAGLTQGTKAYDDAIRNREKVEQQFSRDVRKIKDEDTKYNVAKAKEEAKELTTSLVDPFKKGINDMILSGKSFGSAMSDVAKGIESSMLSMIENVAEQQIEKAVSSALAQISTNAGVAASGAAASQASIPYVGPVLAVAAAASMLALVLGYQSLAHASGGMVVDHDQLVFAHKDEQILPAHLARGFTNIINNGGGGGSSHGGDTTLNYSPTINGHAPANMESMLRADNGRTLLAFLKQANRDGRI